MPTAWISYSTPKATIPTALLYFLRLQIGHASEILAGIIRLGASGELVCCRILDFAEDFGISGNYEPLVLGERRGG